MLAPQRVHAPQRITALQLVKPPKKQVSTITITASGHSWLKTVDLPAQAHVSAWKTCIVHWKIWVAQLLAPIQTSRSYGCPGSPAGHHGSSVEFGISMLFRHVHILQGVGHGHGLGSPAGNLLEEAGMFTKCKLSYLTKACVFTAQPHISTPKTCIIDWTIF